MNGGVMVIKPDEETFTRLILAATNVTERTCCPTQEFLFRFFELRGQYNRLPAIYNLRKAHRFGKDEQEYFKDSVKIYHFVERTKPVLLGKRQAASDYYASMWWNVAEHADAFLTEWADNDEPCIEIARRIRSNAINPAAIH